MRRVPGFIAAALIVWATSSAMADPDVTVAGTIKTIDMLRHTVTLTNGSTYKLARGVNLESMKAGQKVTLTFRRLGSAPDLEASAITPAED